MKPKKPKKDKVTIMAQENLTRAGIFRNEDVGVIEPQLRQFGKVGGYLTATGMLFIFPDGLTAPQITQAQNIINAHVVLTDRIMLTVQQQRAIDYLKLGSPSNAQVAAAVRELVRIVLKAQLGRAGSVDGVNLDA